LAQNGADEAGRLEAALERIARASARATAPAAEQAGTEHIGAEPAPDTQELAARLDMLIEELRAILGQA
jgi:hypothetical protein